MLEIVQYTQGGGALCIGEFALLQEPGAHLRTLAAHERRRQAALALQLVYEAAELADAFGDRLHARHLRMRRPFDRDLVQRKRGKRDERQQRRQGDAMKYSCVLEHGPNSA